MNRRALAVAVVAGAAAGCTCGRGGGVEAHVSFRGFTPGCVELVATDASEPSRSARTRLLVTERRTHKVGVVPGPGWGRSVMLEVTGFERDCEANPVAFTSAGPIALTPAPGVVELILSARDGDGDGWVAAPLGSDCDDVRADVGPGRLELCDNAVDDDCNGSSDCEDARCNGLQCAPAAACRPLPGSCATPTCVQAFAPVGAPCGSGGMRCRADGICVPANTELDCSDGLNDDNDDAGFDCADSDCENAACDAGLCVVGARCGAGTCQGTPKACGAAPGPCRDAGVCNPRDGTCSFPPVAVGQPCDDGSACTTPDRCDGAGLCQGIFACTAGVCGRPFCDAGLCDVSPRPGGCDDGMSCTHSDSCSLGVCGGTAYSCASAPAPACQMPTGCDGDGGCLFGGVADGTSCAGATGQCLDAGCVPFFPYSPSNVVLADVPPAGDVLINCRVELNTSDGGATGNWCGGPAPALYTVTQAGSSEPALVLSMNRLTLTADGGQLRAFGALPLVLLVWDRGTTGVDGLLDARTTAGDAGPGADRPSCGPQVGHLGATSTANRGSGGGGAGYLTGGSRGGQANTPALLGGDGGSALPASPSPLLGGCPGGRGGAGLAATGGAPGSGGGAVQLSVAGQLRVGATARLSVSGGGGAAVATNTQSGGGGGGSGGMLLLEAGTLTLANGAFFTANGGAGAEAADANQPGNAGEDGRLASTTAAVGGNAAANEGGNGGDGASTGNPGTAENSKECGGGGGGAAGRIYLRAPMGCTRGNNFSPAPTTDAGC